MNTVDASTKSSSKVLTDHFAIESNFFTTSELKRCGVRDINKILKNKNIWTEYINNQPNGKKLEGKIDFIMLKNPWMCTLSVEILNIIISGDAEIYSKIGMLSKTMGFVKESVIVQTVLETVVANGFAYDAKLPRSIAAYLCATINRPNYLTGYDPQTILILLPTDN